MTNRVRAFLRRHAIPSLVFPDPSPHPLDHDIFCFPPTDERKTTKLMETKHFRVFASRFPQAEGHLMIVPKQHLAVFGDVPQAWFPELEKLVRLLSDFHREKYGAETFLRENGSPPGIKDARQSVPHAHLQLIPVPPLTQELPEFRQAKEIAKLRQLARYRLKSGGYHFASVGGRRFVMSHVGQSHRTAEYLLKTLVDNPWDPDKVQPVKYIDPEARIMLAGLVDKWNSWIAERGLTTPRAGVQAFAHERVLT